jgi:hypothetical protein
MNNASGDAGMGSMGRIVGGVGNLGVNGDGGCSNYGEDGLAQPQPKVCSTNPNPNPNFN